jgi:hypothetical protein
MPSITPDHIWADRRYLPVVVPGLLLCAAWLLGRTWRLAATRPWRLPAQSALAIAAILLIAGPVGRSMPLAGLHEDAGLAARMTLACEQLGDDAAIVLLGESDNYLAYRLTQPLRSHCGVPAVFADATISNDRLVDLSERAGDRTLYVVTEYPELLEGRPVGEVFTLIQHRGVQLEQTLTMPPRDLVGYGLDVLAAPVQPASMTGTG